MIEIRLSFPDKPTALGVAGALGLQMNYPITGYNDVEAPVFETVTETVTEYDERTYEMPGTVEEPVLDGDGNPVLDPIGRPVTRAVYQAKTVTDRIPRTSTVSRQVEVIGPDGKQATRTEKQPIYDTTKPAPAADGKIPPMPPLWNRPIYYNAILASPSKRTGTDGRGRATIEIKPGFHILTQIDINSIADLTVPDAVKPFIVFDNTEEVTTEMGTFTRSLGPSDGYNWPVFG